MPRRDFLNFAELSNPIAVGRKARGDFFQPLKDFWPAGVEQKVGCILEAQPVFFQEGGNLAWKFGAREAGRSRTEEKFQARVHQAEAHHILGAGEQNASRGHDPRGKPTAIAVSGDGRFSRRGPSESVSNGHRGSLYAFTLLRLYHCKRRNSALNPGPTAIIKP